MDNGGAIIKISFENHKIVAALLSIVLLGMIYLYQALTPQIERVFAAKIDAEVLAKRIEAQISENISIEGNLSEYYVKVDGSSMRIYQIYDIPCEQLPEWLGVTRKEDFLDLDEIETDVRVRGSHIDPLRSMLEFEFDQDIESILLKISQASGRYVVEHGTQNLTERLTTLSQIQLQELQENNVNSRLTRTYCNGKNLSFAPDSISTIISLARNDYEELTENISNYLMHIKNN